MKFNKLSFLGFKINIRMIKNITRLVCLLESPKGGYTYTNTSYRTSGDSRFSHAPSTVAQRSISNIQSTYLQKKRDLN